MTRNKLCIISLFLQSRSSVFFRYMILRVQGVPDNILSLRELRFLTISGIFCEFLGVSLPPFALFGFLDLMEVSRDSCLFLVDLF